MEGTFDIPIFDLICLFREVEGHPAWVPFLSHGLDIKKSKKNYQIIREQFDFPFPISDRESFLVNFGVDRLDRNGSVLLLSQGINTNKAMQ